MYALKSKERNLGDLRSIQDWFLKYELTGVPGVSEVASIGGFVKQYQITVDPNKLRAYNIPISKIRAAVQRSNNDVGGRVLEMSETEFMVRGVGYIQNVEDIEDIVLGVDERRHAHTSKGRRYGPDGPGDATGTGRAQRRRRSGRRDHCRSLRSERLRSHPKSQGQAWTSSSRVCRKT